MTFPGTGIATVHLAAPPRMLGETQFLLPALLPTCSGPLSERFLLVIFAVSSSPLLGVLRAGMPCVVLSSISGADFRAL